MSTVKSARALGWASLAIGATELAATRWLEETMGVEEHGTLIRAYGMREILNGAMILAQPGLNKTLVGSLWARVAGDALDLATLATAAPYTRNPAGLTAIVGMVLGTTALDLIVATRAQRELNSASEVSHAARHRVQPTEAMPNGATPVEIRHRPLAAAY